MTCEVVFFIRSIYHLGKDADNVIESMDSGSIVVIECNKGHRAKMAEPDKIEPRAGKRLALKINVIPYLENMGFVIEETFNNVDDVIVAVKK